MNLVNQKLIKAKKRYRK